MEVKLISYFFNAFLFHQMVRSEFTCDQSTDNSATCKYTLTCIYDEFIEESESLVCRCLTKINGPPIPDHFLTYNMFNKICSKNQGILRELWVNDVELEEIDNTIFEKYKNLQFVNLAKNKLKLNFSPQAINLTKLDISENGIKLIETRQLDNLKSLKSFDASFNSLTTVNNCFKNIKNLEEIYLNNNKISQIANQQFDHLSALKILNLAHNLLSNIESHLYLPRLTELYLNNNKLSSINSHQFIQLPNLRNLDIANNVFEVLGDLHNFGNLEQFSCASNKFTSVNQKVFEKLGNLKFLNLSNNAIKSIDKNTFAPSAKLIVLDVSSNLLSEIDPTTFKKNFNELTYLNLNNNSLTEKVLNCDNLQNLIKLNYLHMSFNQITKIYNCTFEKLGQLKKLNLMANQLEQVPPTSFDALTKLRELNLAQNKIMELPDGLLDSLNQLEKFNISNNKLARLNKTLFQNNAKLESIDVSNNDFVNPDVNLLSCKEIENLIGEFEKSGIAIEICRNNKNCCTKAAKSSLTMLIICVSIGTGILVGVILFGVYRKCCKSNSPAITIIPLAQQK